MGFKTAEYWKKLPEKRVKCLLCPHNCFIDNGEVGKCNARMNMIGQLKTLNYGKVHEILNKSIEEIGLFHFCPGENAVSIIVPGENLSGSVHQGVGFSNEVPIVESAPGKIIKQADKMKVKIIAQGGEPFIGVEFMKDIAKKQGKKNVFSSKGFVSSEVMVDIAKEFDGGIFDVFSMREEFYEKIFKGELKSILNAIKTFYECGKWIEIRMPLIKEFHDDFYDIRKLISWVLRELGPNVPLHFYSINVDSEIVERARKTAIDAGMNFVYSTNNKTTFCPNCKKPVIVRGEKVENSMKNKRCLCGEELPGVWD
ncbi:MAG: hypothetical protein U9Q06_01715 [Nanoarchaeota archaeon]|nr:hypothetical protein [Nanoarchaeota archaeon]